MFIDCKWVDTRWQWYKEREINKVNKINKIYKRTIIIGIGNIHLDYKKRAQLGIF